MDPRRRPDRAWHLLTALVAGCAVLFQLWLVVGGAATLLPESQPALPTRLVRFVPFVNVGAHGYAVVAAKCVGVAVLFVALAAGAVRLDRRLPARARAWSQG